MQTQNYSLDAKSVGELELVDINLTAVQELKPFLISESMNQFIINM